MTDTGHHRTERLPLVIVVGIDEHQWQLRPHLDDELPHTAHLLWVKRELGIDLRPHRPVGVIPGVVHTAVDEKPQPIFPQEIVDVALAEARRDAGEQTVLQAVVEPAQGAV